MFPVYVEAFPWDVASPRGEKFLERLRGDVGITGVSVVAASPPISVLRAYNDSVEHVQSPGGLYYHPQSDAFASSRCKPVISSMVEVSDTMPRALDVCDRLGLGVRFVASVLRSGQMLRHYGEYAAVSALGARSTECLCGSNEEVKEFARSLAASLRSLKDDAELVVSDVVSSCEDLLLVPRSCDFAAIDPIEQALMSWCFCDKCAQKAEKEGIDVAGARAAVRKRIHTAIQRGPTENDDDEQELGDDDTLQSYWSVHLETVAAIIEAMSAGGRLIFAEESLCDVAVSSLDSLQTMQVFAGSLEEIAEESADEDLGIEVVFPASLAGGGRGSELTATLKAAVDLGLRAVTVRHLGVITESSIAPLKQAVRFARRSS